MRSEGIREIARAHTGQREEKKQKKTALNCQGGF